MITRKHLSLNDVVVQGASHVGSDMDGETVLLSVENGKYYNLGEIGGRIWRFMQVPIAIHQIVSYLIFEYDVEQSVCEEQVISFLEHLYSEQLIQSQSSS